MYEDIMQQTLNYRCPKCSNTTYNTGQMRATGGFWTKIFDIQSEHFTTVTCQRCYYTEFFRTDSNTLENVFDFFTN